MLLLQTFSIYFEFSKTLVGKVKCTFFCRLPGFSLLVHSLSSSRQHRSQSSDYLFCFHKLNKISIDEYLFLSTFSLEARAVKTQFRCCWQCIDPCVQWWGVCFACCDSSRVENPAKIVHFIITVDSQKSRNFRIKLYTLVDMDCKNKRISTYVSYFHW